MIEINIDQLMKDNACKINTYNFTHKIRVGKLNIAVLFYFIFETTARNSASWSCSSLRRCLLSF